MRCPKCLQPTYFPSQPCTTCQFNGDFALVEELDRVDWVLEEITAWSQLGLEPQSLELIRQKYAQRRRDLEIALGLRLPHFSAAEAQQAWPQLIQREALLQKLAEWLAAGWLKPTSSQSLVDQVTDQTQDLTEQLEGHPRPTYPQTEADQLDIINFLLQAAEHLQQNHSLASAQAETQLFSPLLAQKEQLEIQLGLRPTPVAISEAAGQVINPAGASELADVISPALPLPGEASHPDAARISASPRPPAPPLRDRLWRTLLSERTLQALLFLGIFLLFTAALSFVIWGWQNFSAPIRVAIPTGFTAIFFGLGWYVRTKTPLYRSGVALSAIAALLIPIDFYTIYINFHIPTAYWPAFWLLTSLVSLGAYFIATLIIRSRFFGYMVGVAAGSIVLALIELCHQNFSLSLDWRTAGLSLLAGGLLLLAAKLESWQKTPALAAHRLAYALPLFTEPFRFMALLSAGVLMPLTFGWRYTQRPGYDTLHAGLTLNWWLGGLMFGWGAVRYRSRSLGLLAAMALPVATYLVQAAIFDQFEFNPAWHALGLALLTPLYFYTGYKLLTQTDDPIIRGHGRTATGWGVALLVVAACWSLTDLGHGAAAASSHAVLTGAVVLAALLWQRPAYLYGASLLSFSATTFAMAELDLSLADYGVGWAALTIAHIIIAVSLGTGFPNSNQSDSPPGNGKRFWTKLTGPLVKAGYALATVALAPSLLPYDGPSLAYALGNWLGLAAWGARLAHQGRPGFVTQPSRYKSVFHWLTALPLPVWLWVLFANRGPLDFDLPLALAFLAWALLLLSYRLAQLDPAYRLAWSLTGLLTSLVAPLAAVSIAPDGLTPGLTLISAGLLYFADAVSRRRSLELAPATLVTAWGFALLLEKWGLSFDAINLALAALIGLYLLAGLKVERQKSPHFTPGYLGPLYLTAHLLTMLVLWRVYLRPLEQFFSNTIWTDSMRLWGAAGQLVLAVIYGLYAWGKYKERWGHLAVWLAAAGGGIVVITYSQGQGSSAAWAASMALGLVLAERGLHWLLLDHQVNHRKKEFFRLIWRLYRPPLLWAGWTLSAGAIGLALIRNLWWLGGGRIQQSWAVAGLLVVTALYAVSVRLFRQARFVWLAALLIFAPWTILTNLGWYSAYRPTLPGFALSWLILAWLLFLLGLLVRRLASASYALPLKVMAQVLTPLALLWGVADVDTSRFTYSLAAGLYGLAAGLDHYRLKRTASVNFGLNDTKYLYPVSGLIPVWCVYLLAWLLPAARHEHYGLMLLLFGPVGLLTGQWLKRIAPKVEFAPGYDLPAYLAGYGCLIVGTLLAAHLSPLLALVLLYDALMLAVSAWLFRNPLWLYPTGVALPISLLLALSEAGIAANRQGWWLIGLASIYLALAWTLRRMQLPGYGSAPLTLGFALIALGLPPSSQDQDGALWGYSSAALLYGLTAFWLRQPLLLIPACALMVVPYAVGLQKSSLTPPYYGLALFPGALVALGLGQLLDKRWGSWRDFPWGRPAHWARVVAERLLNWWSLPFYALGFGLACASPLFTGLKADLTAWNLCLLMPIFGWAIYRFRLRVWLLALAVAGHLAGGYYLAELGWWRYPVWAWHRFLLVTLFTSLVALFIGRWRREGSPLGWASCWFGWSRPLYIIVLLDIIIGQIITFMKPGPVAIISLGHALIFAVLASFWVSKRLPYLSAMGGVIALIQWLSTLDGPIQGLPVALASLTLGYGLVGYGLAFIKSYLPDGRILQPWLAIWELPLQRVSMLLSWGTLVLTAWLGLDVASWTIRAIIGLPFRQVVEMITVQMVVQVLALLGLLYMAAAVCHRWLRLGYVAVGMLLSAWMLQAFYVQQWANVQWYAIPAGLYLLTIGYLEWQRGNKTLARWIDYAAMILILGSLFWQTMLFGWGYALGLGLEGFGNLWWGSARRLRRFFYAGIVAVVLAAVGQLINSLQSINQWIVFGSIGLLLVVLAIIIERKLDSIKAWYDEVLEAWE